MPRHIEVTRRFRRQWPAVTGFSAMMLAFGDGLQACADGQRGWQRGGRARSPIGDWRRTGAAGPRCCRRATSPSVLKAQQQWGVQAATDYTEEASRLARLVTSISLTGTTPDVQDAASF